MRDTGLLPASKRYLGAHITVAKNIADKEQKEFYIFSGKFGLIHDDEPIHYYDYFLTEDDINKVSSLLASQIKENKIDKITFYTKSKWTTYNKAFRQACQTCGVDLIVKESEE